MKYRGEPAPHQINACVPGTGPQPSLFPAQNWGQRRAAVKIYVRREKKTVIALLAHEKTSRARLPLHFGALTRQLVNIDGARHS